MLCTGISESVVGFALQLITKLMYDYDVEISVYNLMDQSLLTTPEMIAIANKNKLDFMYMYFFFWLVSPAE